MERQLLKNFEVLKCNCFETVLSFYPNKQLSGISRNGYCANRLCESGTTVAVKFSAQQLKSYGTLSVSFLQLNSHSYYPYLQDVFLCLAFRAFFVIKLPCFRRFYRCLSVQRCKLKLLYFNDTIWIVFLLRKFPLGLVLQSMIIYPCHYTLCTLLKIPISKVKRQL